MTSVWERQREREVEAKAEGIACKTVLRPPFFVNFAGVNIPTEIKCADNIREREQERIQGTERGYFIGS